MSLSRFTSTAIQSQRFSIPEIIVHYLAKNPTSAKLWKKLIQTCKYFYSKNPVIVVKDVYGTGDSANNYWNASSYLCEPRKNFVLQNCSFKFWITVSLSACRYNTPDKISSLIPKIYRFDEEKLCLSNVSITFDEFRCLVSSNTLIVLTFDNVIVKHPDGSLVDLVQILEQIPRIQNFRYTMSPDHPLTVSGIDRFDGITELKTFNLLYVYEGFDVETFSSFMKSRPNSEFYLVFSRNITSEEYIARLQTFADTILKEDENRGAAIYISFPQLSQEKKAAIEKNMFRRYR